MKKNGLCAQSVWTNVPNAQIRMLGNSPARIYMECCAATVMIAISTARLLSDGIGTEWRATGAELL